VARRGIYRWGPPDVLVPPRPVVSLGKDAGFAPVAGLVDSKSQFLNFKSGSHLYRYPLYLYLYLYPYLYL
jgi:hypothetical protein